MKYNFVLNNYIINVIYTQYICVLFIHEYTRMTYNEMYIHNGIHGNQAIIA